MADTIKTNLGPVTAYADAKAHGYTGTREEFGVLLANAGNNADAAAASAAEAKKTLESIPADYSTLSGKVDENTSGISELKEDLNELIYEVSGEYDAAQTVEIAYDFIVGNKYTISNASKTSAMNAFSYDKLGGVSVEAIGTIPAGKSILYSPNITSGCFHFYINGAGSFKITNDSARVPVIEKRSLDNSDGIKYINNSVFESFVDENIFEVGGTSNGANVENATRLRNSDFIDERVTKITAKLGYEFFVNAYDNTDKFVGMWDGTNAFNSNFAYVTEFLPMEYKDYKYRIVVRNAIDTSAEISVEEAENIVFERMKTNSFIENNNITIEIENSGSYTFPFTTKKGMLYKISVEAEDGVQANLFCAKPDGTVIGSMYLGLAGRVYADVLAKYDASAVLVYATGKIKIKIIEGESLDYKHYSPLVTFEINHDLMDVSEDVARMQFTGSGASTVLEQVYSLFDELCENHSDYITRVDAAEVANIAYPAYANGVSSDDNYLDTPAYKMYMYKLICSDDSIGNKFNAKKKKMLLISAMHGNETASPFNTYLFAKNLCENYLDNIDFYKFRSAFDVYIIPCVNGYGMYHLTRGNANKVNLECNFPTKEWYCSGEDTKDDAGYNAYSGESAGSEFETRVIMNITKNIRPDVAFSHHNYSKNNFQFYVYLYDDKYLRLAHNAFQDCIFTFKKYLPQYFGTKFGGISSSKYEPPAVVEHIAMRTAANWWTQNGITMGCLIEISQGINYLNGELSDTLQDNYGDDAFSVAEYTFRTQILRYCQWVLENA